MISRRVFLALPLAAAAGGAHAAPGDRRPVVDRVERVGAGLYEVAVGQSTDAVYVASTGPGQRKIFVLEPRTLAVRTTFPVEDHPAFGLAFNNRTRTLYTSNTRAGTVSAIDAATGKLLATIASPDGGSAHVFRVLVDEAANLVYVSLAETPARLWIIDGATNTLRHQITNVGGRSTGLALDASKQRLFLSSLVSSEILEIDLGSRQVARRFASGGIGATHLAFDGGSRRLFATHQRSGDLAVLDADRRTLVTRVPTGAGALGVDLDERRRLLYVANRQAGTVSVVDLDSYEVLAQLTGGTMPNTVAVDGRTGEAFVTFKARPTPRTGRGQPGAAAAPPAAPPVADPGGDTVARIVTGV